MFQRVLSYFWKTDHSSELSLDEAYNILKDVNVNPVEEFDDNNEPINNYETCVKLGEITGISSANNNYIIDGLYEIKSTTLPLSVGTKISYQLLKNQNTIEVVDVHIIDSTWSCEDTRKSGWYTRTVVGKVRKRIGRKLLVEPGEITVDLNLISTEFIPVIGDWVHLDVNCEVDEHITDLCGKILQIQKVLPLRPQIKLGKISKWNSEEFSGEIDRTIFFNREAVCSGYVPCLADKIVAEIIESDQGTCSWRALKIVPEYLHSNSQKGVVQTIEDCVETNHKGLIVTDNISLKFSQLGETKLFTLTIENEGFENFQLIKAQVPTANSQCRVATNINDSTVIAINNSLVLVCECTAKTFGETKEVLILTFKSFKLKRWIKINVGETNRKHSSKRYQTKPVNLERNHREIVRGRPAVAPRFIPVRISEFPIPEKLMQIFSENSKANVLKDKLLEYRSVLGADLTYMNYENKFHHLVYLDEISNLISMKAYDQDRACFITSGEYLLLEIENLAERRPSVIMGDKIIARSLFDDCPDFEGFIHKVTNKHVYVKFAQQFHDCYDGQDYSITVVPTRTAYKRKHYAITLAVRNLGREFLFPTKLALNEFQVNLKFDQNDEAVPEVNGIKLEWYNKSLNFYQKEAVINVLLGECRPLPYIIFGPPGTGKTVTLVEIILQILRLIPHSRLLVTAPSNSAADLLALRLIQSGVLKPGDLVRLLSFNAIANVSPKLAPFSVTGNIESDGTESKEPMITETGLTLGCSSGVLGRHRITVSTCSAAGILYQMGFPKGHFSHIIVDEAAQTSEPNVMVPLVFLDVLSGQAILAGDPMQLGPVILSKLAAEFGLEESFVERLINRFPYLRDTIGFPKTSGYDPKLVTKLIYNYRSLPVLLKLPSLLFYHDELIPTVSDSDSKEAQLLFKLKEILPCRENNETPCIVFHGIVGMNYQNEDSPSWYNPYEAAQVFFYLNELYRLGLGFGDVGIITPYKAQSIELTQLFREAEFDLPKIGTVEEFQGQEFNVIILSTVRSNSELIPNDLQFNLGFVSNARRLNVSITRAKSLLIIVGNPNVLCIDKCWRSVIDYCIDKGCYVGCEFR